MKLNKNIVLEVLPNGDKICIDEDWISKPENVQRIIDDPTNYKPEHIDILLAEGKVTGAQTKQIKNKLKVIK